MARLTSVTVQGSFGYNYLTPAEFVKLGLSERIQLIMSQKVEFLDENGNSIPSFEAVDQLPRPVGMDMPRAR
ncbi:MAG: hypothetical protein ACT4NL_05155 [Pseudomarimonas sp.]